MKLVHMIAARVLTLKNLQCEEACNERNEQLLHFHSDCLDKLLSLLPSGSGFDSPVTVKDAEIEEAEGQSKNLRKLVLDVPYHPMEDGGYMDWVHFEITLRPCLTWYFEIEISGGGDESLEDYVEETMVDGLLQELTAPLGISLFDYVTKDK